MLVYCSILKKLSDAGYSIYRLEKERILSCSTIDRLRHSMPVSTATIDIICGLLECQPGDLLTWVPDPKPEE